MSTHSTFPYRKTYLRDSPIISLVALRFSSRLDIDRRLLHWTGSVLSLKYQRFRFGGKPTHIRKFPSFFFPPFFFFFYLNDPAGWNFINGQEYQFDFLCDLFSLLVCLFFLFLYSDMPSNTGWKNHTIRLRARVLLQNVIAYGLRKRARVLWCQWNIPPQKKKIVTVLRTM